MKKVKLSQGRYALVDDEDYEYLNGFNWFLWKRNGKEYAIRNARKNGKKTTTTMHRDILQLQRGEISDHKNGNGLDNRKSNLRICSLSNNAMNRKPQQGTSPFKGVSLLKGRWKARIKTKGIIYNLGWYDSQEEAAMAYNNAAKRMFGEFALLNVL